MARWALILVVAAAALWSGWWIVGARSTEATAIRGIDAAEIQGWQIARDDLSVRGFPNRFDLTLDAPRITTPDGWTLAAPILRAFALSYRPNHLIAVAPPQMTLSHPTTGDIAITSDDLRASLVVTPSATPALDRATLVIEALRVGDLSLATGQIATRQAGGVTIHDLAIDLSDLVAPGLEGAVDTVDLDATLTFDRAVRAGAPARLDRLELRGADLVWQEARATLSGEMSVMSDGTPRGSFALRLTAWEPLLEQAIATGLVPAGQAPLIAAGLRGLTDDAGQATVPVTLEDGLLLVLGLPVATLPRLPVPGR